MAISSIRSIVAKVGDLTERQTELGWRACTVHSSIACLPAAGAIHGHGRHAECEGYEVMQNFAPLPPRSYAITKPQKIFLAKFLVRFCCSGFFGVLEMLQPISGGHEGISQEPLALVAG
jgi:hypothetical protein